jgi:hypothetical protein
LHQPGNFFHCIWDAEIIGRNPHHFQEDEILSNHLTDDLSSAKDFITQLTRETRLITYNFNSKGPIGYDTDPVVRYFSSNSLMRHYPERYDHLQKLMLSFYEDKITEQRRTPEKAVAHSWAIIEALYHLCRLILNAGSDPDDNRTTVIEKVREWIDMPKPTDIAINDFREALADAILSDFDLPLLLRRITGENGLETLVRLLRSA